MALGPASRLDAKSELPSGMVLSAMPLSSSYHCKRMNSQSPDKTCIILRRTLLTSKS